jgi:hypothetical protein
MLFRVPESTVNGQPLNNSKKITVRSTRMKGRCIFGTLDTEDFGKLVNMEKLSMGIIGNLKYTGPDQ